MTRADWIAGMRTALTELGRLLDAPPHDVKSDEPPDSDRPSPDPKRPSPDCEPDIEEERYAIACAWSTVLDSEDDNAIDACPLVATMFTALASVYEGAEGDPPSMGVLMAIRETVSAWSHAHSESTLFSPVAYADLTLLARRIDVAMALVKCDAIRAGAR